MLNGPVSGQLPSTANIVKNEEQNETKQNETNERTNQRTNEKCNNNNISRINDDGDTNNLTHNVLHIHSVLAYAHRTFSLNKIYALNNTLHTSRELSQLEHSPCKSDAIWMNAMCPMTAIGFLFGEPQTNRAIFQSYRVRGAPISNDQTFQNCVQSITVTRARMQFQWKEKLILKSIYGYYVCKHALVIE